MHAAPFPTSRCARLLALLVPFVLLAGCTVFGGGPEESSSTCVPPEEGDGWRIAAHRSDSEDPRDLSPPSGGAFATSAQAFLAPEERCVAGAYRGLPDAQELRLTFDDVPNSRVTLDVTGLGEDASWTCTPSKEGNTTSGDAGTHLSYRIEATQQKCVFTLTLDAGAPRADAQIEWRVEPAEGATSLRFSAATGPG